MELSEREFMSLSSQMSDRDVRIAALEMRLKEVERDLLVAQAERDEWKRKYEHAKVAHVATQFENAMLKNYLWLSWSKIKSFVACVTDIRLVSFLQTFMQKTVDEAMGPAALEAINEVVALPDEHAPGVVQILPTAQAGINLEHADVVADVAEEGSNVFHHKNNDDNG